MSSLHQTITHPLETFPHDNANRKDVKDSVNTMRQDVNTCPPTSLGPRVRDMEMLVRRGE
jgi:hypothetical protein